ncbi:unnamed protein product [Protopolystoma xenopodis]|uniref:Uncharacterized protein n=1 Tax=Protopolystoma xenopodis TaxID=117903 RepID=A0A3S5BZP6_9PLAT|nr:unnamed protein product [Protopolystoma xenopodis]
MYRSSVGVRRVGGAVAASVGVDVGIGDEALESPTSTWLRRGSRVSVVVTATVVESTEAEQAAAPVAFRPSLSDA